MKSKHLFSALFSLFLFVFSFSSAFAIQPGDACPTGVSIGTIICDPSQNSQARFVCSRTNPPTLITMTACTSPQVCSPNTGACVNPAVSAPTGILGDVVGTNCIAGAHGQNFCLSQGTPSKDRVLCNINSVFVDSSCQGEQTCSNGLCVGPTAPPVTTTLTDGASCPTGYIQGQHLCDPTQGVSARYTCSATGVLVSAFCNNGVACHSGDCASVVPTPPNSSTTEEGSDGTGDAPLCQQAGTESQDVCRTCFDNKGIWTGIGCIPFGTTTGTVRALMTVGLGIAGAAVLLMTLAAGFLLTVSRDDPKQVEEAKALITSAVTGILFIIFSVSILRYIGVTILQLPAFG